MEQDLSSRKRNVRISHEELSHAIAKYLRGGGRIVKLPEQKSLASARVGGHWNSSEIDPLSSS
jgi:hypothetical protein